MWWLQGPGARVWIIGRPGWLEADVALGPPRPDGTPFVLLGYDFVPLEAVRHVRGLPVMRKAEVFYGVEPDDPRDAVERFRARWREAGESGVSDDGATLRLDHTERAAINNALKRREPAMAAGSRTRRG